MPWARIAGASLHAEAQVSAIILVASNPQHPRTIPEFVMHQLESPANLDRITDPRIRLLLKILIRTGLRIGDATQLALDCLVRDPQGAELTLSQFTPPGG